MMQTNADAATMFTTFWIEEISEPANFLQLQYVQTVFLNFPVLGATSVANLTWPHVSVASGEIVEEGATERVIAPQHPYTRRLIESTPRSASQCTT
jgi:hypothetical protein